MWYWLRYVRIQISSLSDRRRRMRWSNGVGMKAWRYWAAATWGARLLSAEGWCSKGCKRKRNVIARNDVDWCLVVFIDVSWWLWKSIFDDCLYFAICSHFWSVQICAGASHMDVAGFYLWVLRTNLFELHSRLQLRPSVFNAFVDPIVYRCLCLIYVYIYIYTYIYIYEIELNIDYNLIPIHI